VGVVLALAGILFMLGAIVRQLHRIADALAK
jgi:hypothetical protein